MKNRKKYPLEAFDFVQQQFGKFHDHQMHGCIYFAGHINTVVLKQAVIQSFYMLPQLNCRLERKNWVELEKEKYHVDTQNAGKCAKFDTNYIIEILESEYFTNQQVLDVLSVPTDLYKGPQIRLSVLRSISKDILCVVMNHMLCDGMAFKEYLYVLSEIYSHIIYNEGTDEVLKRYNGQDRSVRCIFACKPEKNARDERNIHTNEALQIKPINFEGNNDNAQFMMTEIDSTTFLKIKQYAKKHGVTINDMFLSAYFVAAHQSFHVKMDSMICAVDLRKYLLNKQAPGLCNLTSNLYCTIPQTLAESSSFEKILAKVHICMLQEKKSTDCLKQVHLLDYVYRYLPFTISSHLIAGVLKNPPIAFTNLGIIDAARLQFAGTPIEECFLTGSMKKAPNFQVAVSTFQDKVRVSINMKVTEQDKIKIEEFLKNFKFTLKNVCN